MFGVRDGANSSTLAWFGRGGSVRSVFVTSGTPEHTELLDELAESLRSLGLDARADADSLSVDGVRHIVLLLARAHPTPADLAALVGGAGGRGPAVLVADRLSEAGRAVLRDAGWGWVDRRGHVRVWAPGLRVESPVAGRADDARRDSGNVWTTVGLEIALHALMHPDELVTARRVAPEIGRSVGTTHELIARFSAAGLVGPRTHRPLLPELFWETAANWPDRDWTPLPVPIAEAAARVGPDDLVRVDERAATLGGARIAAAGELPARCYVRSPGALRRLRSLVDRDEPTRSWIRPSPVEWLPLNDEHPPDAQHPWSVAHPMLCAVRLAADPARGREIVEDWGIVPTGAEPADP
jgi:hypothetical protein